MQWNWGAGSGTVDGRTVGLQLGGRWTVGTGSTENAVLLDGRLSRIGSELGWTYSARDWMAPTASTAGRRTSTSAGDARRMFCHARGMTSPPAPGRDAARHVSSGDPVAVPSASRRQGPTASSAGGLVTCTVVRGVAQVRLSRPEKLNALTLDMLDELLRVARRIHRDPTVRAVVLWGEGEAFCAGMDLRSALRTPSGVAARFLPRPWSGTNVFQEACWVWRRLPVPVIAAVHGHCLGGGLQLALGADLRVTAPDATWSVREAHWGLVPDMSGTRALTELLPLDVAKELTLTARRIEGTEAARIGLATRVSEDPVAAAIEIAEEISAHDRQAVASGKRLLNRAVGASARAVFARERWAQLRLLSRMDRAGLPGR